MLVLDGNGKCQGEIPNAFGEQLQLILPSGQKLRLVLQTLFIKGEVRTVARATYTQLQQLRKSRHLGPVPKEWEEPWDPARRYERFGLQRKK